MVAVDHHGGAAIGDRLDALAIGLQRLDGQRSGKRLLALAGREPRGRARLGEEQHRHAEKVEQVCGHPAPRRFGMNGAIHRLGAEEVDVVEDDNRRPRHPHAEIPRLADREQRMRRRMAHDTDSPGLERIEDAPVFPGRTVVGDQDFVEIGGHGVADARQPLVALVGGARQPDRDDERDLVIQFHGLFHGFPAAPRHRAGRKTLYTNSAAR